MGVRERILVIRLLEKMKAYPSLAEAFVQTEQSPVGQTDENGG